MSVRDRILALNQKSNESVQPNARFQRINEVQKTNQISNQRSGDLSHDVPKPKFQSSSCSTDSVQTQNIKIPSISQQQHSSDLPKPPSRSSPTAPSTVNSAFENQRSSTQVDLSKIVKKPASPQQYVPPPTHSQTKSSPSLPATAPPRPPMAAPPLHPSSAPSLPSSAAPSLPSSSPHPLPPSTAPPLPPSPLPSPFFSKSINSPLTSLSPQLTVRLGTFSLRRLAVTQFREQQTSSKLLTRAIQPDELISFIPCLDSPLALNAPLLRCVTQAHSPQAVSAFRTITRAITSDSSDLLLLGHMPVFSDVAGSALPHEAPYRLWNEGRKSDELKIEESWHKVLREARKMQDLADEVFCQLMKQLSHTQISSSSLATSSYLSSAIASAVNSLFASPSLANSTNISPSDRSSLSPSSSSLSASSSCVSSSLSSVPKSGLLTIAIINQPFTPLSIPVDPTTLPPLQQRQQLKGWILFCSAAEALVPSQNLLPFILNFIHSAQLLSLHSVSSSSSSSSSVHPSASPLSYRESVHTTMLSRLASFALSKLHLSVCFGCVIAPPKECTASSSSSSSSFSSSSVGSSSTSLSCISRLASLCCVALQSRFICCNVDDVLFLQKCLPFPLPSVPLIRQIEEIAVSFKCPSIPIVLPVLCKMIVKLNGLYVEGIFRKSVSQSKTDFIESQLCNGDLPIATDDPCSIAVAVKIWCRSMHLRLIPVNVFKTFQHLKDDPCGAVSYLRTALPPSHLISLLYLLRFLRVVGSPPYVAQNKMTFDNIAIVVAPNIIPSSSKDPLKLAAQMRLNVDLALLMINGLVPNEIEESYFAAIDAFVEKFL
ncbi:putative RhoGAP domain [Monocercomonoides exilis]|uniref:putative RhoGAP domain n=1 Tax=Monocercomonoides exilis TaxID=2049356 RepID=UPI00355A9874|nr:putative RhoGAP domain [Monocercomonoides exilis]|eukprot:MONOS_12521.1-p1 / transcript=MONOS_12521.1 / gene=MONOS_12521 / organism=Monocercomonoides_exilis_PA203 / gene_product=unspecified product / transcript_product=unspecified product / location=Mono_scaffold00697:21877-25077(+) / protein_length=827 / sequence_SO=supercontig / SO=protein_coding / is_pseudo=false